jgi:FixJ family two-component response regulator
MKDPKGDDKEPPTQSIAASEEPAIVSNPIGKPADRPMQTVHIVDDDPAVIVTLMAMLDGSGISSVGYRSATRFLSEYKPNSSGCLLLDVHMPGMSGLDLQQRLADSDIWLPVIMITGISDVAVAVQAMKLGAIDLVQKPFVEDRIIASVRQALTLDIQLNAQRVSALFMSKRLSGLTERERNILEMAMRGFETKEIARVWDISPRTVDAHRANILKKLQVRRVTDLFSRNLPFREPQC